MRLPKKIIVSGYTLTIMYAKKIKEGEDDCYGLYDPDKKEITLAKGMSQARKKEVFIHEYLHFLEDIYRIKISHENLSSIALGIMQILNNPKIQMKEKK